MFWGLTLENGKQYSSIVEQTYHLSMAAVEPSNNADPVSVWAKVKTEDEEEKTHLLCTLDGKTTRQVALDLLFVEGTDLTFSVKGNAKVYLTGYLAPDDYDFDDEELSDDYYDEEDEEEDEEVEERAAPKRTLAPGANVPSKKAKTQASPQAAKMNGKANPVANGGGDSADDDEDDDDEELSDDEELGKMLAGLREAKYSSGSGADMSVDDDEDDDDEDEDDEDDDDDSDEADEAQVQQQKKNLKETIKQGGQQQKPQQKQQQQQPQHQGKQNQNQRGPQNQQKWNQGTPKQQQQGRPQQQGKWSGGPQGKSPGGFNKAGGDGRHSSPHFNKNKASHNRSFGSGQKFGGKKH